MKLILKFAVALILGVTTSAQGQGRHHDLESTDLLEMLDGGTYSISGAAGSYTAKIHLLSLDRGGSADYDLDFVVGRRPYRCKATLIQAADVIGGQTKSCVWMDNGQTNPTQCNLFYRLTADGIRGKAYCNVSSGYDAVLVPGGRI